MNTAISLIFHYSPCANDHNVYDVCALIGTTVHTLYDTLLK